MKAKLLSEQAEEPILEREAAIEFEQHTAMETDVLLDNERDDEHDGSADYDAADTRHVYLHFGPDGRLCTEDGSIADWRDIIG